MCMSKKQTVHVYVGGFHVFGSELLFALCVFINLFTPH